MNGAQYYSELANWDGGVSIASVSGGNAFTPDRELEPPLPSGSPSSRPCAGSLSSSQVQGAGIIAQGSVCHSHKDLCAPPTAALPSPPSASTTGTSPAEIQDTPMDMDVDSPDTAEGRVYAGQDRMDVDNGAHDASAAVVTDAAQMNGRPSPPSTPGGITVTQDTPLPRSAEDSSTVRMGTSKEIDALQSSPIHAFKNAGFAAAIMSRMPQEPTPPQSAGVSPPRTASSPAPDKLDGDSYDPCAAEEASSLLDADGETDNESTTSYHVVPLPTASQSSSTAAQTGASSDHKVTIQRAPPHALHMKASQGTVSDKHRYITHIDNPGPIASTSKLAPPRRVIRPSQKAQASAIAPRRKTPLFVDSPSPSPPPQPRERANPYKRRKLNYAYVEIPPLPAACTRADYMLASTIPSLQDPLEDDYATQLGQVLTHASIVNARGPSASASASPVPKRRGRPPKAKAAASITASQRKGSRQTKSVSVAPSAVSARTTDASASVSNAISRKRGRPAKIKDEHQASEVPAPIDAIPPEVQKAEDVSSEEPPEAQPRLDHPADSLEALIPSTPVDIGTYPVPSLASDIVVRRHLLENGAAPPAPPRPSPPPSRDWVLEGWPPAPVHAVWAYHFFPPLPLPFEGPVPMPEPEPEPAETSNSTGESSEPRGETAPRRSTTPDSLSTALPASAPGPGVDAQAPRYVAYPPMPYPYGFPYSYPYPYPYPFPFAVAAGPPPYGPDAAQKALPMLPVPESRSASAPDDPAAHPSPSSSPPPPAPPSQAMATQPQASPPAGSSSQTATHGEVFAPVPSHRRSPVLDLAAGTNEKPASTSVLGTDVTEKESTSSNEHSTGPAAPPPGTAGALLAASSSSNAAQPMDQNSQSVVRAPQSMLEALAIPAPPSETHGLQPDATSRLETDSPTGSFDYSDAMNMDMLADLGPSPSPPPGMPPDNPDSTSNGVSSDAPRPQDAHNTSAVVTTGLIASSGTSTSTSTGQSYVQFQYSSAMLREIASSVKKGSPQPNGHGHGQGHGGASGACVAPMDVDGTGSLPWMLDAQRDSVPTAAAAFDFGAHMQAAAQQAGGPFDGGGNFNGTINPALLGGMQHTVPEPGPSVPEEDRERGFGRRGGPPSTLSVRLLGSTSSSVTLARARNTANVAGSIRSRGVDDSDGTDSDSDSEDDRPLAERLPVRNFPFALPREMALQQKEREKSDKRARTANASGAGTSTARAMGTGTAKGTKGPAEVVDLTISDDDDKEEDDMYVLSSGDEYGKGKAKGKATDASKGKGKGKAAGAHEANGKSPSKAKATTGKAKGKGKAVDTGAPPPQTFRHRAEEPTFCHQCRNSSVRDKMRCTTLKGNGTQCGLRYCDRCVDLRYPDVTFNPFAVVFKCPRCLGTCNCTSCSARRGEQYISARVGRLPPPGSTEALALQDELAGPEDRMKTPPVMLDQPPGTYWGVVFDNPKMERWGLGYVGKTNDVVLRTEDGRPVDVNKKHTLKKAKKKKQVKVVAYIGKRREPSAASAKAASTSALASDPTPATAQHQTANLAALSAAVNDPPMPNRLPRGTPPATRGRMYIGKRSALASALYVSVTELIARALRQEQKEEEEEEEDESFDMYMDAPSSDPAHMHLEDAGPLAMVDVQCAVAIALSSLGDSSAPSSVAWSSALSSLSDLSDVSMG